MTKFQDELKAAIRLWHWDAIDTVEKTVEQNMEAEEKAWQKLEALIDRCADNDEIEKQSQEYHQRGCDCTTCWSKR